MTPKHKCHWTFAFGLVEPYVVDERSSGCLKRLLRICASWIDPTLAGSNAGSERGIGEHREDCEDTQVDDSGVVSGRVIVWHRFILPDFLSPALRLSRRESL